MGKDRYYSRSRSPDPDRHYKQRQKHKKSKHRHQKHKKSHRHHQNKYEDSDKLKYEEGHPPSIKYQLEDNEQPKPKSEDKEQEIQKPNFQPSGILLQYYNARDGVSLRFHEPPEARKPLDQWRIYPFKNNQSLNPIILKESCYLIGKDERVCDILCENPSISRQHAVIQFRGINKQNIDGSYSQSIHPYIMDLQSTNGTLLNEEKIEFSRYYQLLDKDALKFGLSEREYVLFQVPSTKTIAQDQNP